MQILAAYYKNIWPMRWKTIVVNLQSGAHLIKGNIGKGKSFLFFDGIMFWLYKYQNRKILNTSCDTANVSIIFENYGNLYLIERSIKKSSTGSESVQSKLFLINDNFEKVIESINKVFPNIKNENKTFAWLIRTLNIEEITFKNQNELQNNLNDILIDKDVFTNTNFLMQDSDNIFDMTASDRIAVLKNIFNLNSIDYAKEVIKEVKGNNNNKIKAKDEKNKDYTINFNNKLKSFLDIIKQIQNISKEEKENCRMFSELESIYGIVDSINMNDFTIEENAIQLFVEKKDNFEKELQSYLSQKELLTKKQNDINEKEEIVLKMKESYLELKKEIEKIEQYNKETLNNLNTDDKEKLVIDKKNKLEEVKKLENVDFCLIEDNNKNINENLQIKDNNYFSIIQGIRNIQNFVKEKELDIANLKNKINENEYKKETALKNIENNNYLQQGTISNTALLNNLKMLGVNYWTKISNLENNEKSKKIELSNFEEKIKNADYTIEWTANNKDYISRINTIIQNKQSEYILLKNKFDNLTKDIDNLLKQEEEIKQQLNSNQETLNNETTFECEKIGANCPFIKVIKKKTLSIIEGQIEEWNKKLNSIKEELLLLKEKKETLNQEIENIIQEWKEIKNAISNNKIYEASFQTKNNLTEVVKEYQNTTADYIKEKAPLEEEIKNIQTTKKELNDILNEYRKVFLTNDIQKIIDFILQLDQTNDSVKEALYDIEKAKETYTKSQGEYNAFNFDTILKELNKAKGIVEKEDENTKTFLINIKAEEILKQEEQIRILNKELQEIDNKILKYDEIVEETKKNKEIIIQKKTESDLLDKDIQKQEEYINLMKKNLKEEENDYNNSLTKQKTLKEDIELISKLEYLVENIKEILVQFNQDNAEIKKFIEDDKRYSNIYNILNKELVLMVLDNYIPAIEDIINSMLAQVVDYTLKFRLIKTKSDKVELEIVANDEKGERPVKSLSGGQKVILKIVWVLAISRILNVNFLFMDETINNLDVDTISKVSTILENYIKSNIKQFYLVTHSTEIQNMSIWNSTIDF